jgi:hypothetical protein
MVLPWNESLQPEPKTSTFETKRLKRDRSTKQEAQEKNNQDDDDTSFLFV